MNDEYFGDRRNPSENDEGNDQLPYTPVVEMDPFADRVPADADLINPAPMGGTVAAPVSEAMVPEAPVNEPVLYMAPTHETTAQAAPVSANVVSSTALLEREESDHFRTRWNEIQGKFVDEPRTAVQQADALVSEVVENITQMFAKNHSSLESQWNQGNDVSTEDLRKALQQYRSFFNRLVV